MISCIKAEIREKCACKRRIFSITTEHLEIDLPPLPLYGLELKQDTITRTSVQS